MTQLKNIIVFVTASCALRAGDARGQPESPENSDEESSIHNVWDEAKFRGVSFRAIGQEPGWLLEITDGAEILLVTDYGQTRTSYRWVEPIVLEEERKTEFIVVDDGLRIEIRDETCRDVMSGGQFPVSVSISLAQSVLSGCGRALH